MINRIKLAYRHANQLLLRNFYLFWIEIAFLFSLSAITYLLSDNSISALFYLVISPLGITHALAVTNLINKLPSKSWDRTSLYIQTTTGYYLKVALGMLAFFAIVLPLFFYAYNQNPSIVDSNLAINNSGDNAIDLYLVYSVALGIVGMIIPYINIHWAINRHSFIQSVLKAIAHTIKHLSFTFLVFFMSLLHLVIYYLVSDYSSQSAMLLTNMLFAYLTPLITAAALYDYKKHS